MTLGEKIAKQRKDLQYTQEQLDDIYCYIKQKFENVKIMGAFSGLL